MFEPSNINICNTKYSPQEQGGSMKLSAPGPHGKLYKPDIGQPKNILRETFGFKDAQVQKP